MMMWSDRQAAAELTGVYCFGGDVAEDDEAAGVSDLDETIELQ